MHLSVRQNTRPKPSTLLKPRRGFFSAWVRPGARRSWGQPLSFWAYVDAAKGLSRLRKKRSRDGGKFGSGRGIGMPEAALSRNGESGRAEDSIFRICGNKQSRRSPILRGKRGKARISATAIFRRSDVGGHSSANLESLCNKTRNLFSGAGGGPTGAAVRNRVPLNCGTTL